MQRAQANGFAADSPRIPSIIGEFFFFVPLAGLPYDYTLPFVEPQADQGYHRVARKDNPTSVGAGGHCRPPMSRHPFVRMPPLLPIIARRLIGLVNFP